MVEMNLCGMSLKEIAQLIIVVYKDLDDIQGLIENKMYEEAKKKAIDSMRCLESCAI